MSRLRVVLNRTIYPRNIGMCARAMANMGLTDLVLVGLRTPLTDEAKQGAAHAQEVLANARIYPDFPAFLAAEGEGLRIALSGKDARLGPSRNLADVVGEMTSTELWHDSTKPIYLLFGPEDDGLSADEMEICHAVCRLPTYGEITSLNVSHAVLLACYIVRNALPEHLAVPVIKPVTVPAYFPGEIINRWLSALGFDLSSPRITIEKTLNRILLSHNPTNEELRVLNTVLQQTVRKLTKSE